MHSEGKNFIKKQYAFHIKIIFLQHDSENKNKMLPNSFTYSHFFPKLDTPRVVCHCRSITLSYLTLGVKDILNNGNI